MTTDLETLLAFEQLRQLKARYFRCLDTKDWAGYADVFTDDATLDVSDDIRISAAYGSGFAGDPEAATAGLKGGKMIAEFVRAGVGGARTVHHGHTAEFALVSPTEATGLWAMADIVEQGGAMLRGDGHYHDRYRLTDVGWRIAEVRLSRLRLSYFAPGPDGRWLERLPPALDATAHPAIRPLSAAADS